MAIYESYVICTSPRSGSTLLCSLLRATGIAGNPGSHFHRPSLAHWLEDLGVPPDPRAPEREMLARAFRAAIALGRGDGRIFALRLQRHSFAFFAGALARLHPAAPDDPARFRAAFGRTAFVHLTRPDKLEQAISCVKAEQTGLWHMAADGTELERLSPPREPVYDAARIKACLQTMTAHDSEWIDWFDRARIAPLSITYDALSVDPAGTLAKVLGHLGLDPAAARGIEPGVRKLSDHVSRDWAARFRAEGGAT